MVRCIVMANGDGTRWGNYEGVPKHLIDPTGVGETLLERTTRQLGEWADNIHVIGPEKYRPYVNGAWLHSVPQGDNSQWLGTTKFMNTVPWWASDDKTILFFGDVFYTDDAVRRIVNHPEPAWLSWCRFKGLKLTGSPWGEIFAVSFFPEHHDRYRQAVEAVVLAHRRRMIRRSSGWEVARAVAGARGRALRNHNLYHNVMREIDDWTEDFDFPKDLDKWRDRWFHQGSRS